MGEGKLKRFLFPTEDERVDDIINDRPSVFSRNRKNQPEVTDTDDFDDVMSYTPVKGRLNRQAREANPVDMGVMSPSTFEEAEGIAKDMMAGRPVIVNLEKMHRNETTRSDAARVVDFLAGVAYALQIKVSRINNSTFIFSARPKDKEEEVKNLFKF